MNCRVLLLSVLLLGFFSFSKAQTINLKILRSDSEIGFIRVEKITKGDSVSFISKSKLEFRFIWKYEWSSTVSSILKKERLDWSRMEAQLNNKPRDDKHTFYKDNKYYCFDFEDQKEDIKEVINFTSLMMYYGEPVSVRKLYSERFQKMVELEKIGQRKYKIKFPNGDVNHYYYKEDGSLEKVDAFRTLFDLVFVPA